MDYKDTLFLPRTDFPMRANLPQNEPARIKHWQTKGAYAKMASAHKGAKRDFSIHDGPPYANGHIHLGHALNKILKDIVTKTHYFFGDNIRYTPGWDCHGLPIEQQIEVKLGEKKKEMSVSQIREMCREHAKQFIDIQRDEFKELGIIGDWDKPYLTLKFKFEAEIYDALCKIAKKGLLTERRKPVYWSWAAKTALAEAEVEYKDKEDYSIYVAFDLDKDASKKLGIKGAKAVIWTTTPWTLPANEGISLKPDETYVVTEEGLIFAKELLEVVREKGMTKGKIVKEFISNEIENTHAINPLNDRRSLFMLGEHVLMDGGTGLVHTAPGHGEDDYHVALRYRLPITMPVDDEGKYDDTLVREKLVRADYVNELVGLHVFKANEKINQILGSALIHESKFIHSYPHCWRTHKPVIYRATKQWFIAMDEPVMSGGRTLREVALSAIKDVRFYPASGIKRLESMIENRPDWCISRQRDWGVPIAFLRDKATKEPIFDDAVLERTREIFEQKGADAWWDLPVGEFLPAGSDYDAANLEKVSDILDVWFDSGSTWKAVLTSGDYDAGGFPCDVYLEGSDQHRGWFQSSLLISCAINEYAPFRRVITHGFTVDENGQKMSKSLGNVIAPQKVAKDYGVEILRLWVALSDYSSELKLSENILKQLSEQYRKIRNTIRFLLANVADLDEIDTAHFGVLDQWILNRASIAFNTARDAFRDYEFAKGFGILLNFLSNDLSGIYLDICKDRLYCDSTDDPRRTSAQSVMVIITRGLLPLIAPTLTYTVDEVIAYAPAVVKGDAKDVFDIVCAPFEYKFDELDPVLMDAREKFFEIIDTLKKDKIIKNTLELDLETNSNQILQYDLSEVIDWFMVSDVRSMGDGEALAEFEIGDDHFRLVRSAKHRCPRCWRYQASEPECLCPRCSKVLNA